MNLLQPPPKVIVIGASAGGVLAVGAAAYQVYDTAKNAKTAEDKGRGYGGAAGLFSVVLDARFTRDQTDAFCDALRLFKLGYSWGGPISLVVPYDLNDMRMAWPSHLARGTVVRFSIGLEAVQDLQDDIAQALRVLR